MWSVYEVVGISRGEHCDLQDLFRGGKPVRVYEHRGTQSLVKWDRLAARVLIMDDKHRFSGGILPLPQEIALSLLELMNTSRKRLQKELARTADRSGADRAGPEEVDAQILQSSCPAVSSIWLLHTLTRLRAPLPTMVNREGDPLVFSETRFPVDANKVDEIVRCLDAAADYERGDPDTLFRDWSGLNGNGPRTRLRLTRRRSLKLPQQGQNSIVSQLVPRPGRRLSETLGKQQNR